MLSSYSVAGDGTITPISANVTTTETAACWVVVTKNGRYTYTTNTGSNSISGYRIAHDGAWRCSTPTGRPPTPAPGRSTWRCQEQQAPLLAAGGVPEIKGFAVNGDGSLDPLGTVGGLPAGTVGLAAS